MHPTLSEVNLKTSLKLFFRDHFENREENPIPIMYDKNVTDPYVSGVKNITSVNEWITINFTDKFMNDVSTQVVEFVICTRQDPDGRRIEEIVDEVNELLFPENGHLTIPFYDLKTDTVIGSIFFMKKKYGDSGIQLAADGTKFYMSIVPFRWVASL